MKMRIHCGALFLVLTGGLVACTNAEQEPVPVLTRDHLFFDFSVTGAEDIDNVTLRFEFRQNSKGRSLLLKDSAEVELDGEKLSPDSSKYSGVYYESSKPRESFVGQHSIKFRGIDGVEFKEPFWFLPFRLREELPAQISRKPFTIRVDNPDTSIKLLQLVMVDTSFRSRDVNEEVAINNDEITITENMWSRLANGPIIFELHSEKLRPLSQKTRKGGRIAIYYSLNREFELTE
jgi:hypothetical protein